MRRCPFCNRKAPQPLAACEYCGARLGILDELPAWRAVRRRTRGPRRALRLTARRTLPRAGPAALLLAALLGPTALVAAIGPEHLVGPMLLALEAAALLLLARRAL